MNNIYSSSSFIIIICQLVYNEENLKNVYIYIWLDIDRNDYHTFDPSYITQYVYMCITLKLVAETSKFKPNYKIVC